MADEQARNENPEVDSAKARASLDRLFDIYKDIAETADEVMLTRCPYKDASSRCTAKFGCRNQFFTKDPTALPACAGSDQIDYREAWDT
ncbi:MAG: hypothetical protein HOJ22_00925 [Chloroflexi bacterium]|jgi:hypothetical protein|nr:hypothetical protein [Chloroflexota bacterium]MBT5626829.1 hypothetical protein [Chloroflexota bacterium]